MNFTRVALVIAALAVALSIHAQSPLHLTASAAATAPVASVSAVAAGSDAPSPTMPQTIAFVGDTLTKQGVLHIRRRTEKETLTQSVQQDQGCTLDIFHSIASEWLQASMGTTRSNLRYVLDLENSDPHSVRIEHDTDSEPDVYELLIDRANYYRAPLDNPKTTHGPPPTLVQGLVQSATPTSITILSDEDNTLITYMLTKKSELEVLDDPADPNKSRAVTSTAIKAGDVVNVEAVVLNAKKGVAEAKKVKDFGDPEFSGIRVLDTLTFVNQDKAERVAKAIAHAITLCHKPDTPSLF